MKKDITRRLFSNKISYNFLRRSNRAGAFFSTDALIALIIIFFIILAARPLFNYVQPDSEINSDILTALSTLKVSELDDASVQAMISDGTIKNPDKTLIEQIGEFYVFDYPDMTRARNLAGIALKEINTTQNFGIWYGDSLILSKNMTAIETAAKVDVAKRRISGVQAGESSVGYSARAFLSSNSRTKYFYFGGYVGDGNISVLANYDGEISDNLVIEIAVNKEFDLYINNISYGHFDKTTSSVYEPERYIVNTSLFSPGTNILEFRGDRLFIAGGYVKISYRTDNYSAGEDYNFPGIDGLVNLYDALYVSEDLEGMEVMLHANITYPFFFNFGNVTLYNGTTIGEQYITLDNSEISSLIGDYGNIEGKMVPLRLGLEELTEYFYRTIDVFTVTDLSSSMNRPCGGCSSPKPTLFELAKDANRAFIRGVLNYSGNRVGLVGYSDEAYPAFYHSLSNNTQSLNGTINSWNTVNNNCICCGINRAVEGLTEESSGSKKIMVVMGDGRPQGMCAEQNTGSADTDAIEAARQACEYYGIVTHTVGFGPIVDETVMIAIANAGCDGSYYYSEDSQIVQVYQTIAEDLITSYAEQTVSAEGLYTKLYPDSYVKFSHNASTLPFGLFVTSEVLFDDENGGSFSIPADSLPLETTIVSYSGARWTAEAKLNGNSVFNLTKYGTNYVLIGDPYQITLKDSIVLPGSNNYVNITTGVSVTNRSSGSAFDKIIYTILKNASSYSEIKPTAQGCIWNIQFEDGSYLSNLRVPSDYLDADNCVYDSVGLGEIANSNDVYQLAVLSLLRDVDLDDDGMVDIFLNERDLDITLSEIDGIPFPFDTEVQVRTWS